MNRLNHKFERALWRSWVSYNYFREFQRRGMFDRAQPYFDRMVEATHEMISWDAILAAIRRP